jgi:ribosomal protein S18 acetylase RimI-like enzyme
MNCSISDFKDIIEISVCHRKAFPNSYSSKLPFFFTRKMFQFYLDSPRALLFHVRLDDEIIGYCGLLKTKISGIEGSSTTMSQYLFGTMIRALLCRPWALFHKDNFKRIPLIKKNILLKFGIKKKAIQNQVLQKDLFEPFWGLVVIGVDPRFQGKGIGTLLLQEFEKLAKGEEIKKLVLSVNTENLKAINSYKRNNWVINSNNGESITMFKKI